MMKKTPEPTSSEAPGAPAVVVSAVSGSVTSPSGPPPKQVVAMADVPNKSAATETHKETTKNADGKSDQAFWSGVLKTEKGTEQEEKNIQIAKKLPESTSFMNHEDYLNQ